MEINYKVDKITRDSDGLAKLWGTSGDLLYVVSDRASIYMDIEKEEIVIIPENEHFPRFRFTTKEFNTLDIDGTGSTNNYNIPTVYGDDANGRRTKLFELYQDLAENLFFQCCASVGGGGGSTIMTDFSGGNWKIFYTNGSGDVQELALGSSGEVLTSNGASSAPSWQSVAGGKWFMEGSFTFVGGGGTRYYLGATVGGINNHSKNYFIDPYTNIRVLDVYRAGIQIPFAVNNIGFKVDVNSSVGSVNVIARLLKAARAADGTSYTTSLTPTQIATTTKAIGSANTVYHVDASSANGATSTDFLVFGLECDTAATIDCSYTLYGDL